MSEREAEVNCFAAAVLFSTRKEALPSIARMLVEQTLLGNASELKESGVGIEAFGREPSYDVTLNPVVRTTAAEVRKRLARCSGVLNIRNGFFSESSASSEPAVS